MYKWQQTHLDKNVSVIWHFVMWIPVIFPNNQTSNKQLLLVWTTSQNEGIAFYGTAYNHECPRDAPGKKRPGSYYWHFSLAAYLCCSSMSLEWWQADCLPVVNKPLLWKAHYFIISALCQSLSAVSISEPAALLNNLKESDRGIAPGNKLLLVSP